MIWSKLLAQYKKLGSGAEQLRLGKAARELWPQAAREDLEWVARLLLQGSELDFCSSLLFDVPAAPRLLLEPLIHAAVHWTAGALPQHDRVFTEYAIRFFGADAVDAALLRSVSAGTPDEARAAVRILEFWTFPSALQKRQRQDVYVRAFVDSQDEEVDLGLIRYLWLDEAPSSSLLVKQALHKARTHGNVAIQQRAEVQVGYVRLHAAMPGWIRDAWHAKQGSSGEPPPTLWPPPAGDPGVVQWLMTALCYTNDDMNHFAARLLSQAPTEVPHSVSLRLALVRAAIKEYDPSFNAHFVKSAIALFGADAVLCDVVGILEQPSPERDKLSACNVLYWVRGDDITTATWTRRRRALLSCFLAGSTVLQRRLAQELPFTVDDYPAELRTLAQQARSLALAHPDPQIRQRATGLSDR